MKTLLLPIVSLVLASACATTPDPVRQAKLAKVAETTPICDATTCPAMWDAAQLWVVKNAAYKIQNATNVLIETYNPVGSTTSIGARVIKEPAGGGKSKITIAVYCDNIFGCFPDTLDATLSFNEYVNAAAQ